MEIPSQEQVTGAGTSSTTSAARAERPLAPLVSAPAQAPRGVPRAPPLLFSLWQKRNPACLKICMHYTCVYILMYMARQLRGLAGDAGGCTGLG